MTDETKNPDAAPEAAAAPEFGASGIPMQIAPCTTIAMPLFEEEGGVHHDQPPHKYCMLLSMTMGPANQRLRPPPHPYWISGDDKEEIIRNVVDILEKSFAKADEEQSIVKAAPAAALANLPPAPRRGGPHLRLVR